MTLVKYILCTIFYSNIQVIKFSLRHSRPTNSIKTQWMCRASSIHLVQESKGSMVYAVCTSYSYGGCRNNCGSDKTFCHKAISSEPFVMIEGSDSCVHEKYANTPRIKPKYKKLEKKKERKKIMAVYPFFTANMFAIYSMHWRYCRRLSPRIHDITRVLLFFSTFIFYIFFRVCVCV